MSAYVMDRKGGSVRGLWPRDGRGGSALTGSVAERLAGGVASCLVVRGRGFRLCGRCAARERSWLVLDAYSVSLA